MGNRAVITSTSKDPNKVGIYLHWNGGPESVQAFLAVAKKFGIRGPIADETYCFARLTQIIGNWSKGTTSLGVGPITMLDTHGDNGVYEIDDTWEVKNRTLDAAMSEEIFKEAVEVNQQFFS